MARLKRGVRELLTQALPEFGVRADPEAVDRLSAFLERLVRWNARVRLVGSADPEELVYRHVGESVFLGQVISLGTQRLLDVGSGAGFPGLALQLSYPGLSTTLVEVNAKKAAFLKEVVREQQLGRVIEARVEDVEPQDIELITVRALERMQEGPGWAERHLARGGQLAAWLSMDAAREWRERFREWEWREPVIIPGTRSRAIVVGSPAQRRGGTGE